MIKALLLIFDPIATWEGIWRARRSIAFILALYILPLLVFTSACEAYGLVHWGKWQMDPGRLKKFTASEAAVVETFQFVLSLFIIFMGANLLKSIGETFHGRHTFNQAFATVAYSLGPLFMLRLLDAFQGVSFWVSWSIGILLTVAVMYHGVPRMMEPDPSHAFGLFLMSALLLLLVTGLVRFVTGSYLEGKFPVLQHLVTEIAGRLPF